MKITKTIYVSFVNSNSGTANIVVNFKVSKINIKSIGYVAQNPTSTSDLYCAISSDLVDGQPLGLIYTDSGYPFNTANNLELTLLTPKYVNGNFTFYITDPSNAAYTPNSGGTDKMIILAEFIE